LKDFRRIEKTNAKKEKESWKTKKEKEIIV